MCRFVDEGAVGYRAIGNIGGFICSAFKRRRCIDGHGWGWTMDQSH